MVQKEQKELDGLKTRIIELSKKVYEELGGYGWYGEDELKNALAKEFRDNRIAYLQELSIPIIYKKQQIKMGEIDFIVFTKNGMGILLEIKHTAGEINSSPIHQAIEYFKALTCKDSPAPAFLKENVKEIIVFNWEINKDALVSKLKPEPEQIKKPFKEFEKYFKNIHTYEIFGIEKDKKGKVKEHNISDENPE